MVISILEKTENNSYFQCKNAPWSEYLALVEKDDELKEINAFYNEGKLWIKIGNEGINHAIYNDLFTMIFGLWFMKHPDEVNLLGGCIMKKQNSKGISPDKIVYVGGNSPKETPGESKGIDLDKWRVPDLVGEISDTTLAIDLDEKKQIYADLGIREYWVIDIKGNQVIAFILQENGKYKQCEKSPVLSGLPIELLEQTLTQLDDIDNGPAALWFSQQIANM